jgi:hypothetical protein
MQSGFGKRKEEESERKRERERGRGRDDVTQVVLCFSFGKYAEAKEKATVRPFS